jgi:Phospholipase_D-nuclease N-terminal
MSQVEPEFVEFFPFFFILIFVIGIGAFVVWILALVDAAKVPDDSMYRAGNKLTWILVIVLAGVIGAIIYYAVGRPSAETRTYAASRPPAYPGAQSIDYRGVRYALGRTATAYVIWDSAAGGAPIRQYPLTQEGWSQAWQAYYQELEGAPPHQPGPPS